ncbi:MAG: ATP-binding cassette domain-containing protein [Ilumatobacter sp.]|uniref:ABC transporter ATP-binding protein n=1 Tax=Ilumatobacter sp. TaxID=1967498 RepID=UPI003C7238FF
MPETAGRSSLSLRITDVHIEYELFAERRAALRQRFSTRTGTGRSVVHAVKGVSFDVREGESVGIIGSNGSGKSTLLAAIAGLLTPVSGEILVSEEPKLMGVGATLIPSATGRRNIRLGCLALGMSADRLDEEIDDIIEFTELGEAIDRPLRTYSSGMRARLHFAIATSISPRILLIDEALSTGDRRFREKSAERLDALLGSAGTLLLVSHSLSELQERCERGIWLEQGLLKADGPIDDVIERYSADDAPVVRR